MDGVARVFRMKSIVNSIDEHVGHRLRSLRESRHMSVVRLAKIVGASSIQIERYEAGTARVSAVDLLRIAGALDQTVAFFFQDARAAVAAPGQSPALETLLSEDATELLYAFAKVRDPSARRTIIALTISLGTFEPPGSGAEKS